METANATEPVAVSSRIELSTSILSGDPSLVRCEPVARPYSLLAPEIESASTTAAPKNASRKAASNPTAVLVRAFLATGASGRRARGPIFTSGSCPDLASRALSYFSAINPKVVSAVSASRSMEDSSRSWLLRRLPVSILLLEVRSDSWLALPYISRASPDRGCSASENSSSWTSITRLSQSSTSFWSLVRSAFRSSSLGLRVSAPISASINFSMRLR